ncbi:hypothetical protein [Streptomyces africanus]|uniref:hypothetical protein n=1 Tax=Streptomyces africanus TaxID=231024 RepID=UPI000A3A52E4|nr:hypothetical protein [Streptomyces africanus]
MPETRDLTLSAAAYDRFAAAAAAEGVSVRTYLERIAERTAGGLPGPGAQRAAAGPEADLRLVALGICDPATRA